MLRQLLSRTGSLALVVAVLGLGCLAASCGGGGYAAKDMILVEFLFVDRSLVPTAPTGTQNLPRNAQLLMVFTELVDPQTVDEQTIQVRFGAQGQSVPKGSFSVDGNTVRYDPTVTAQGQPNPFGFQPVTQYTVDIPNFEEQPAVVRNLDADPNLVTFFTTFVTSSAFLRELEPPEVERVFSIPDPANKIGAWWPANGILAIQFSEPMDPTSFVLGGAGGPDENTTVDVRYLEFSDANPEAIRGNPIPGTFSFDAAATTYFFKPTFSFGVGTYEFAVQVFQGLLDFSGNKLINPRGFGPYPNDGTGIKDGNVLREEFDDQLNMDRSASDPAVEWADPVEGELIGAPIDSRKVYIQGASYSGGGPDDWGQYFPVITPFVGRDLNDFVSNVNPPTSEGRRALWSFTDEEMGPQKGDAGSVTAAGWGPDSNATFAAIYPTCKLRCGYKKTASLSLANTFSGNYDGKPTVVYSGGYTVPQAANIGNEAPQVDTCYAYDTTVTPPVCVQSRVPHNAGPFTPCNGNNTYNQPLFDYTGYEPFPEFTTFFEYDPGDPLADDVVFLFDASVEEGDSWQQLRHWFGMTFPCSGILMTGYPTRRMYSTFEANDPDPPSSFALGIVNPEPGVSDLSFTITKRVAVAQSLFYTPDSTSVGRTFGADSDYLDVQLTPALQSQGAQVRVEFQGARTVQPDRQRISGENDFDVDGDGAFDEDVDWTENIHDCDGYACIRWRIFLISNLISNARARLFTVIVPVVDADETN